MRKIAMLLCLTLLLGFTLCACGSYTLKEGTDGVIRTYSYDSGKNRYSCEGIDYAYRLTLSGRLPNAAADSEYVLLSNVRDVTFEQAYRSHLSSDTADFFDPNLTVMVEMHRMKGVELNSR